MILHIKPSASKHQVFRFKSNYIRAVRDLEVSKEPLLKTLLEGIETVNDGIHETAQNISNAAILIRETYQKKCVEEIKNLLKEGAKELLIDLG